MQLQVLRCLCQYALATLCSDTISQELSTNVAPTRKTLTMQFWRLATASKGVKNTS
jgi:hypothetical protein